MWMTRVQVVRLFDRISQARDGGHGTKVPISVAAPPPAGQHSRPTRVRHHIHILWALSRRDGLGRVLAAFWVNEPLFRSYDAKAAKSRVR